MAYDGEFTINTTIRVSDASSKLKSLQSQLNATARRAENLQAKMDELKSAQIPTDAFKNLQVELEKAQKELDQLIEKEKSMTDMGLDFGSQWDSLIMKEADVSDHIDAIKTRMQSLKESGGAYADPTQSVKYKSLEADIQNCADKTAVLNKRLEETARKEAEAGNTGSQSMKKLSNSIDQTTGHVRKMNSGIVGMLGRMIMFSVAFRAFSAITQSVKDGIGNLAQYSEPFNGTISEFVSALATLQNALVTAFAPIISVCLPYITQLINWISKACTAVSKFFALLQGKSTYTRAVKQQKDYAASLKDTAKAAKQSAKEVGKSLAQFDQLNILQDNSSKDSGNSGSGGTSSGGGGSMFEEVPLTEKDFAWMEAVKAKLKDLLWYALAIGAAVLAWKIGSLFTSDLSMLAGLAMIAGGAVLFVKGAFDAWNNGVDWQNLIEMLTGTGLIVGGLGLAFGATAAAVGGFIAGIALCVIAIHDMLENGINLKNSLLLIAGVFATVSAVAGFAVGSIAALVTGLVLAVIKDWENFKQRVVEPIKEWGAELLANFEQIGNGVKEIFSGISEFFQGIFTLNCEKAWDGLTRAFQGMCDILSGSFKATVNLISGLLNTIYNAITGVLNAVIRAINSIHFTVPEWVPGIGGKSWKGLSIPTIPKINIPYLANGAVFKGGNPYMAVVNDQPAGQTNIEAPLDTIKQGLAEVMASKGGGNVTVELVGDAKGLFTAVVKQNKKNTMITGKNVLAT